jgi:hypothetical protein
MPQKVEIPPGSGKYYAYRKDESGKTTYVGTWKDHLQEVKLQDYFQELFSKSKPVETEVMVTTKSVRFFKNKSFTDDEIGRAIDDLRDYTKSSIGESYPEYEEYLKTVFIGEEGEDEIGLVDVSDDYFSTNLIQIRIPQEMIPKLVQCRKTPDEELETVLMRLGEERKGIDEAIQKELTLHHIKYKYEYPIEVVENEVVVRVPSEEKALELEHDLKQRDVSLTTDVLYKSSMIPKKIRLEVG